MAPDGITTLSLSLSRFTTYLGARAKITADICPYQEEKGIYSFFKKAVTGFSIYLCTNIPTIQVSAIVPVIKTYL